MNEKSNHLRKFILGIVGIFAFYQGGAFVIQNYVSQLKQNDAHWKINQNSVIRSLNTHEHLKVPEFQSFVVTAEEETIGRPEKSITKIFSESLEELNGSNQIKSNITEKLEKYYKFTKVNRDYTFSNEDMLKIEDSIHWLLNHYIAQKWSNINDDDKQKNLEQLKRLVNFHYDLARIVYDIDKSSYKLMFPYFYDFIVTTPEDLNLVFKFENNLKNSGNSYLLSVGDADLVKAYKEETKQNFVPDFIFRNVSILNKHINNISK